MTHAGINQPYLCGKLTMRTRYTDFSEKVSKLCWDNSCLNRFERYQNCTHTRKIQSLQQYLQSISVP